MTEYSLHGSTPFHVEDHADHKSFGPILIEASTTLKLEINTPSCLYNNAHNVFATIVTLLPFTACLDALEIPGNWQSSRPNYHVPISITTEQSTTFSNIHKLGIAAELATSESQNKVQGSQRPAANANWR